ncbi:transposable element Tc3 transposase [Trichonephila clavipes]|nr:transposable element Tc3 transposase [Trichonephila clavipes]
MQITGNHQMARIVRHNDESLEGSEELGIAQSVISRLWKRFQDDGNVSRCYSTGHPRVTMPNEDRYLAVTSKRNRQGTASDLSRQLSSATGMTVSRQTVNRPLGHIGLYARRPVRCVPLTATHCRLRLTSSLESDSRRTLIWRASGTRYHQENTTERHRYGGAEGLVWGGIILGSRTDLHVQSVTMTDHIYRDVILEQHVRLFRGAMDAEFLFMDNNARPHRANSVDECLQSEDITRMDWPAYSLDLNRIEHVCDMLGRRIAARQPPSTCIPELRRALLDEWCNIPQDQIDILILSMPMRFCLQVTGCIRVLLLNWELSVESENLSWESDPVDNETYEDDDNNNSNESSKDPSNADTFFALDIYGVVRKTIRVLSYSTTTAQENKRPCSEKTTMCNGTAKNK